MIKFGLTPITAVRFFRSLLNFLPVISCFCCDSKQNTEGKLSWLKWVIMIVWSHGDDLWPTLVSSPPKINSASGLKPHWPAWGREVGSPVSTGQHRAALGALQIAALCLLNRSSYPAEPFGFFFSSSYQVINMSEPGIQNPISQRVIQTDYYFYTCQ